MLFRDSELRASEMVSTSILSNNEVVEKEMKALPIYKELIAIRSRLEGKLDCTLEEHIYKTREAYIEKLKQML